MANTSYSIVGTSATGGLTAADQSRVTTIELAAQFDPTRDLASAFLYDTANNLIATRNIRLQTDGGSNIVVIDPEVLTEGLAGSLINNATGVFNFVRNIFSGTLRVEEISYDRTEVKTRIVDSQDFSVAIEQLVALIKDNAYYGKVGVKHPEGKYTPIINISIQEEFVYLKLYSALPNLVNLKDPISVIQEIADPIFVSYTYTPDAPVIPEQPFLRGANFSIDLDDRSTVTTEYLNYNQLYNLPVTNSYNRIFSQLEGTGIDVNIDYTDYNNFVHFSSAEERLANFKYKLDLIHQYEQEKAQIVALSNANSAITSSSTYYDTLIKNIVSKFDGYEYYLYYESSSKAWPKSNTSKPYINYSSSIAIASNWYVTESLSASLYDELNESSLEYTIPEFIRQDSANAPYTLFLNMIGQHFDELWVYSKAVTEKYNGDNRIDFGIPKDLITKTLQNFGVKLYSSNFAASNLSSLYLGEWYNTGSEYITSFVTASNEPTPDQNILTETYKRIYHNLPYLLKTKGTERGLRALINCFGIPSSSLSIDTFGGIARNINPYFEYPYPATDKVKTDNTGSIIPGNTLSQYVNIIKPEEKYNQDLNLIEVGFSPAHHIDNYIVSRLPGDYMVPLSYAIPWWDVLAYVENGELDIDHFIGDPRYASSRNYNNVEGVSLRRVSETLLSGSDSYNVFDFIRLTKFFDNQLFKMIKDFVPARDTVSAGIIIKPHVLNRSKVGTPIMSFTQPEYTASINTAFITGSAAGLVNNFSTAYTSSVLTPSGSIQVIYNDEAAKLNGELGGTVIDVYNNSLNSANTLKKPNIILPYYDSSGSLSTTPSEGAFHWRTGNVTSGQFGLISGTQVKTIYINEVDLNGNNIENALGNLKPGDTITFTIKGGVAPLIRVYTYTALIESIVSVDAGTWRITLQNNQAVITTDPLLTVTTDVIGNRAVVLNPYVNTANIDYHPYNAVLNNATEISNASFLQEVDYTQGQVTAANINQIISNEATRAQVNEYIHNSAGLVRGKYKGKQLVGQKLNEYTPVQDTWVGDVSYGKTPVQENRQIYFSYFDWAGGTSPELHNKTQFHIRYLIDKDGNTYTPDTDEISYIDLVQNFIEHSNVTVRLDNPQITGSTDMSVLNGEKEIFKVGVRPEPIIYSQSGSSYTGSIIFGDESITDYTFAAVATASLIAPAYSETTIVFSSASFDRQGYYNRNTGQYTFGETPNPSINFVVNVKFTLTTANPYDNRTGITLQILSGSSVIVQDDMSLPSANNVTYNRTLSTGYRNFSAGDVISVQLVSDTSISAINAGSSFTLLQDPMNLVTAGVTQENFWRSGSEFLPLYGYNLGNDYIVANTELASRYNLTQKDLENSQFKTIKYPFVLQPGDEIRFENTERKAYMITEVNSPQELFRTAGSPLHNGYLIVRLDRPVAKNTNVNFFVIRRYVKDGGYIILNTNKPAGNTSGGTIVPQYITTELKDNLNRALKTVRANDKGIQGQV